MANALLYGPLRAQSGAPFSQLLSPRFPMPRFLTPFAARRVVEQGAVVVPRDEAVVEGRQEGREGKERHEQRSQPTHHVCQLGDGERVAAVRHGGGMALTVERFPQLYAKTLPTSRSTAFPSLSLRSTSSKKRTVRRS